MIFVILCKTQRKKSKQYTIFLILILKNRGLKLAEDKNSYILTYQMVFDFLGFNFRRYKTFSGFIHLSRPSKDSEKQFKTKISEICKTSRKNNVDCH